MAIFVGSEIALGQWAEMYAVRVAMLPLGIHFEYIDRTDGRTDGRTNTGPLLFAINTKNCSLSIVLTATDQNPQKSLKR